MELVFGLLRCAMRKFLTYLTMNYPIFLLFRIIYH
jgi:hypothetical protein